MDGGMDRWTDGYKGFLIFWENHWFDSYLISVNPPQYQFTAGVFCNLMTESNSMLIQSRVSTHPGCLIFCHLPQAESSFFTLAFTLPLIWNVTVPIEMILFIEVIFCHFILMWVNCWSLYLYGFTRNYFISYISLLFCSSPFSLVFPIIPASHRGFTCILSFIQCLLAPDPLRLCV